MYYRHSMLLFSQNALAAFLQGTSSRTRIQIAITWISRMGVRYRSDHGIRERLPDQLHPAEQMYTSVSD